MEPECPQSSAGQVKTRDETFFLEIIFVEVEDTLFCIPKLGFVVEGSTFSDTYALPMRDGHEGNNVENPLRLPGVSLAHFRALLSAMYNINIALLGYDEWAGVFHLADMWKLTEIRATAVQHMTPPVLKMDTFEKIRLGQRCNVPSWTIDGCIALVEVTQTPDLKYLLKKGVSGMTAACIFYVRETFKGRMIDTGSMSPPPSSPESGLFIQDRRISIRELLESVLQSD